MQPCSTTDCLASLASTQVSDAVLQNSTCLPSQRGHNVVGQETYVLPASHTCNMLRSGSDEDPDRYHCDELPISSLLFLHLRCTCRSYASEDPPTYQ
jgi:hypothetical protein